MSALYPTRIASSFRQVSSRFHRRMPCSLRRTRHRQSRRILNAGELDEAGVARAGIETTAISFVEGILTPILYFLLFGAPGLFAFKIINMGANMIDVRSTDFADFGRAFAKLNSLFLWPGSKLAVIFISLATLLTKPARTFHTLGAGFGNSSGFFRPHLGVQNHSSVFPNS